MDGHGETSIPPYNFAAGDIITLHTVVGHFQLWNFFVDLDMLNIFAV
jgi:hypothetical protein